ncbi:MAG: sulfotransferase [Blastomonas fulva]|uniref:sulfotransferase family protein n=1 Tax=Blastomonas fulva TaxID=1550728 RepID=UPI0024E1FA61|nr:sulfotransferase [Blastomonas fulva]MDK2755201.1 sulfotransferase [Blastomonas fulva]
MALGFSEIVNAAREKVAVPDPDSDSWKEGLEILLHDHTRQDRLTERGEMIVRNRYVETLAARMQVDEYIRRNPAVLDQPIDRPVFILGMPRTGTTMLSYMLDADPANRSMLRWEAYNAAPPAAPGALKADPRCLAEVARDENMLKMAPKVAAAHFEPGDGPTECVHLIAQDFRSLMLAVTTTVPTYHDWLMFTDMTTAFEHRKRVLQILQSTNPGRWVLKMPSDSLFIRQLFKTFPDARVIWTHRDPYAVVGSSLGMRGNSRPMFEVDEGAEYMRQYFPLQLALHASRPLEVSAERPDDIYHCYYDDLVADPLTQLKQIYRWLGDDWTETAEAGMQGWLDSNPQNKRGKHSYSLEEWGLTRKDLEPYFSDYLRAHPVARKDG